MSKVLVVCTTDSMIWNFLVPHIEYLKKTGNVVECACSRTGFYFDELQQKGLVLHEIPFERNPFRWKNVVSFKRLKKLIHDKNFDIIHCHEPVGGAMGRLAGKANHAYVIYFAHGFHFFTGAPIKHWMLYYVFEYILSFLTDAIVTINNEDYKRALKFHASNCYYIHGIGVDFTKHVIPDKQLKRNEIRKKLLISDNAFVLITVGELSIRKNHKVIIEAMYAISNPAVHLIICGEGELATFLRELSASYHLEDKIHFLGFRKDIPQILSAADIFVYSSLWEGLGIAGIEAMYSGLPVIGSNRRGIKDYVIDNETGFLFEPHSISHLCEIIMFATNNATFLKNISSNAKVAANQYSIQRSLNELELIYKAEGIVK